MQHPFKGTTNTFPGCAGSQFIRLPLSGSIATHMDVHYFSGRLDQGILILTLPLNLPAHLSILHTIYGFSILNGVCLLYTSTGLA